MTNLKNATTNTVKFGNYAICLQKEQLSYYHNGDLTKVSDVNHEFTLKDLYDLAVRISKKNELGAVQYVAKDSVVNKR